LFRAAAYVRIGDVISLLLRLPLTAWGTRSKSRWPACRLVTPCFKRPNHSDTSGASVGIRLSLQGSPKLGFVGKDGYRGRTRLLYRTGCRADARAPSTLRSDWKHPLQRAEPRSTHFSCPSGDSSETKSHRTVSAAGHRAGRKRDIGAPDALRSSSATRLKLLVSKNACIEGGIVLRQR